MDELDQAMELERQRLMKSSKKKNKPGLADVIQSMTLSDQKIKPKPKPKAKKTQAKKKNKQTKPEPELEPKPESEPKPEPEPIQAEQEGKLESRGRGALIVLEGIDRAGKTTQCKLLVEALQTVGVPVKTFRFPDRSTETGKLIDSMLQKDAPPFPPRLLTILMSANRWEKEPEITRLLESGTTVILDRYFYSGTAYSVASPDITMPWAIAPDRGLPDADLVLFLKIDPTQAEKRPGFGQESFETLEKQTKVAGAFDILSGFFGFHVVNAAQDEDVIHKEIVDASLRSIHGVTDTQIMLLHPSADVYLRNLILKQHGSSE